MTTATNVAAYAGSALPREERGAIRARAEDFRWCDESDEGIPPDLRGLVSSVSARDVPALLDALDAAEAEIERLRSALDHLREDDALNRDAYLLVETERDAARAEAAALRTQYRDLATYRTAHANLGLCPEGPDDEARDPDCPVCRVLVAHESGIRGRERAAFAALLDAEDDEE